jgi:hypothetical protein
MKNNSLFILKCMMVFVLITFGTILSASAADSNYNINVQYNAQQAIIPDYLKAEGKTRSAVVTITELNDMRKGDDKKIIGNVRERDDTRVPIFPQDSIPARAVASGIKDYLKKAGYKIADKLVQWDLNEKTIPKTKGKLIIGGSIEEMEVTCWRGVFSHNYKTNLKLTVIFVDAAKGKILYKRNVEGSSSRDDVSFSEAELGGQLNAALGDAIEKVFGDNAVAQKIKEVITQ